MATLKAHWCELCGASTSSESGLCQNCQRGLTMPGVRRPAPRGKRPLQSRLVRPDAEDLAADEGDDGVPWSEQQYEG